jgi:hypothetical protein
MSDAKSTSTVFGGVDEMLPGAVFSGLEGLAEFELLVVDKTQGGWVLAQR